MTSVVFNFCDLQKDMRLMAVGKMVEDITKNGANNLGLGKIE